MHCFHVDVVNPAGKVIKEYAQNIIAPRGLAGFSVPFALNDAEGTWKVSVRDVASGVKVIATVQLNSGFKGGLPSY